MAAGRALPGRPHPVMGQSRDRHEAALGQDHRRQWGPRDDATSGIHADEVLFSHLLDYRNDVRRVVRATSGWLVCSDHALLGMIATQNQLGRQIEALMLDVDRWLCTLMDPDRRTFSIRELIAHHGWPDVDLRFLVSMEADEL